MKSFNVAVQIVVLLVPVPSGSASHQEAVSVHAGG